MADLRVDTLGGRNDRRPTQASEIARRPVQLYTRSAYEPSRRTFAGIGKQDLSALKKSQDESAVAPRQDSGDEAVIVKLLDGTQLELPRMSAEDRARLARILDEATPEQRALLEEASLALGQAAYAEVDRDRDDREAGKLQAYSSRMMSASSTMYERYVTSRTQVAHEDMLNDAIILGVHGMEQDLYAYFSQLGKEQQLAAEVRTDIAEIESVLADWPDDGSTELFDYREVVIGEDGSMSVVERKDVELTKEQAQALVKELNGTVEHLGQIEMRHTMYLQKMVTDYQKAQTTVSNIMRSQHDTHKTLIGNAKA